MIRCCRNLRFGPSQPYPTDSFQMCECSHGSDATERLVDLEANIELLSQSKEKEAGVKFKIRSAKGTVSNLSAIHSSPTVKSIIING